MPQVAEYLSFLLILANVIITYRGFINPELLTKYLFEVEAITLRREYIRLIASGFFHANWWHLLFNMLALYFFAGAAYSGLGGILPFLVVYLGGIVAGNLMALWLHRDEPAYSALGASGGVSAIVLAVIAISPQTPIGLLFLPFLQLPGWIFGLLYLLYTLYGIRSQRGNIGHSSHLGGMLAGVVLALVFNTSGVLNHPFMLVAFLVPIGVFLYLSKYHPEAFTLGKRPGGASPIFSTVTTQPFRKRTGGGRIISFNPKENSKDNRTQLEAELNELLDKVGAKGLESLNSSERKRLEYLSKKLN